MKKILVPTDFSECSNIASEFAIYIAEKLCGQIEYFHVLSTPVNWVKLSLDKEVKYPGIKKKISLAKRKLTNLVEDASASGVKAIKTIVFSSVGEEIFHHIKTHQYDLIIMGSHGENGIVKSVLGSNAKLLLQHADIPVIIVKEEFPIEVKRMVFVSDFSNASQPSFKGVTEFADGMGFKLDLLFVNTENENNVDSELDSNMNEVLRLYSKNNMCTKHIVNASSIKEGIETFVKANQVVIVAMFTHKRSILSRVFNLSVAETIATHINLPTLSIKLSN